MPEDVQFAAPQREGAERASDLRRLASRYVWWQPVETTLACPCRLLCSILSIGTAADYVMAREIFGEEAFIAALETAPPGAVDERSWAFWHRHFGLTPTPPKRRRFS